MYPLELYDEHPQQKSIEGKILENNEESKFHDEENNEESNFHDEEINHSVSTPKEDVQNTNSELLERRAKRKAAIEAEKLIKGMQ